MAIQLEIFFLKGNKANVIECFLKQMVWETQKLHEEISTKQFLSFWSKEDFHILINNLKINWPTKILISFSF